VFAQGVASTLAIDAAADADELVLGGALGADSWERRPSRERSVRRLRAV